ncbi:AMP-binding protein [Erwinia sp. 9145]|uniref:AMP-binding protein n=1 Tax=Erwinia sp. 9145 TaxID=1500895 RepID=UPI00055187E1|nr:AMP-binding protein [Erwinia sp. 9145]
MRFFSLPAGAETAILFNDRRFSRDRVRHLTHCLADRLLNRWSAPLRRVAMLVDPSPEQQICVLALHHAGITCVPLAKSLPVERIAAITEMLAIDLIVTDRQLAAGEAIPLSSLFENLDNEASELTEPVDIAGEADCLILHTSGSTGVPKAIALSRDNIFAMLEAFVKTPLFGASSLANRICSFDFSVIETLPYLYHGRLLHIVDQSTRDSPQRLAEAILSSPAEVVAMTPSWFYEVARQMLQQRSDYPDSVPKKIVFGGEKINYAALAPWWMQFVEQHGYQVFNIYGPTECSVFVTWHPVTAADTRSGEAKIGDVFGENRLLILDEKNHEIAQERQPGRLIVQGRSVASGYLNASAGDRFAMRGDERSYDTGDIGYRVGSSFYIVGRSDNQVKVRGFRVDLDEISRHITSVDGVKDCHVAVFNNARTDHIVAFVTGGRREMAEGIYQYLAKHLPEYALPNHICQPEKIPTNANGKTDEHALRQLYLRTLEEKNVRLLARRIKSRAFPSHYTLADLHLTSLESVELFIELEMAYGIRLRDPDKNQPLRELAALCESLPTEREADAAQETPQASRTLPAQGYYCDNYFKYQIRRDAVSVSLQFPPAYSAALLREGILGLLKAVPSLHVSLREHAGEIWQYDTPLAADVQQYELAGSPTPVLMQDFDFEAGKLFYYQIYEAAQGPVLTLHIAHVISDGYACRFLINGLLQILEQKTPPVITNLHAYATQVWQRQPKDLQPLRQFWAEQASQKRPTTLFRNIPAAVRPGSVEGYTHQLQCRYLSMPVINRRIVEAGISLHAFVAYAVWRVQQHFSSAPRVEFHSPIGNRNRENHAVIANMITIVPFSIEIASDVETPLQLLQMHQAITGSIERCQLSWAETAALTGRERISLIVAESPKPFSDSQRGVYETAIPGPVIAKNALSFFYCAHAEALHIDIRYNASVADQETITQLGKTLDRVLTDIVAELADGASSEFSQPQSRE